MVMQDSQYDFIMSPGAGKKGFTPGDPSSMKKRLILVVVGILGLMIVITVVMSLLFGGSSENQLQLVSLANKQNELIRVSDIGIKKAHNLEAKNLAMTTKLSLSSEQATLQAAIKKQGVKVTTAGGKDEKTDEMLTVAEQNNRFDEEFLAHLRAALIDYQKDLKVAYDGAISKSFKDTLASQYEKAAILAGIEPEL